MGHRCVSSVLQILVYTFDSFGSGEDDVGMWNQQGVPLRFDLINPRSVYIQPQSRR